jgi:hypothetical protein
MGEILRADETQLALLADVLRQTGLLRLSEEHTVPPAQRQQGTVQTLRRSGADRQ